jgi:hypothetical protein
LKTTRKQVDGQMAPPFENLRDGETMEVALDRSMSKKKKKKGRQVVVLEKKGRQMVVSQKKVVNFSSPRKWPPPLAIFWVRHCGRHNVLIGSCRDQYETPLGHCSV